VRVLARVAAVGGAVLIATAAVPMVGVAQASTGLVAEWPLDAGAGTQAVDAVGTANGTLSGGATWLAPGSPGSAAALSLDGVDGKVSAAPAAALRPAQFTLSAWVKGDPQSPPVTGAVIAEQGSIGCTGGTYGLYVGAQGIVLGFHDPLFGEVHYELSATNAKVNLWDGNWHLVAGAVPTGYQSATISIDGGASQFGLSWSLGTPDHLDYADATDNTFRIGAPVNAACGTPTFHGAVDDVRLYDDPNAITMIGSLMPPIATSVTVTDPGTVHTNDYLAFSATVSPIPRFSSVRFDIVNPDTQQVLNTVTAGVDAQGHAANTMWTPAIGTYSLDATVLIAPPYVTSSDSVALVVEGWSSSAAIAMTPASPVADQPVSIKATIDSVAPVYASSITGDVTFTDDGPSGHVNLGTVPLDSVTGPKSQATLSLPAGLALGSHSLVASYSGDAAHSAAVSATTAIDVGESPSTTSLSGPPTAQTHHLVSFMSWTSSTSGDVTAGGATVTYAEDGNPTPLCSQVAVAQDGSAMCTVDSLPTGSHIVRATYSGTPTISGSVSDPLTITVAADTVDATGVGVSTSTFYPYKDSYRDTVSIRGSRQEPISVGIRVLSQAGSVVKTATVKRGSGAYAVTWNGRTSSGAMLAAGRYKVVQTLTDAAGTKRTITSNVTLSGKRLSFTTVYVSKAASSVSAKGTSGTGRVTISTSARTVKLYSSGWYKGWAVAGWQFTLPSAVVYRSIAFQAYVRGGWWAAPNDFALQNFRTCPLASGPWDYACFDHEVGLGLDYPFYGWESVPGSATTNRSGRTVRAAASVVAGTFLITSVRVKVTYGVLR
jgi:hypothetical protein